MVEACRRAIKFGDELKIDDCRGLIENLAKTNHPFVCAHGRPGVVPMFVLPPQRVDWGNGSLNNPIRNHRGQLTSKT